MLNLSEIEKGKNISKYKYQTIFYPRFVNIERKGIKQDVVKGVWTTQGY